MMPIIKGPKGKDLEPERKKEGIKKKRIKGERVAEINRVSQKKKNLPSSEPGYPANSAGQHLVGEGGPDQRDPTLVPAWKTQRLWK